MRSILKTTAKAPWKLAGDNRRGYLAALARRDARLDGVFVYAVRSTGIFCRPSCPSRRPNRKQVVLFESPQAARTAGFRPCRRCLPDRAPLKAQADLVQRVCLEIAGESESRASLASLAAATGLSAHHVQRTFRKAVGITPRQYAEAAREARLKSKLRRGTDVTTAMYEAGYGSPSRLYERSDARLGMTPAAYRRGGRGMKISYTISDCALGRVLVASTDRGISAVSLGNTDSHLESELRKEYPHAEIGRGAGETSRWIRAIVRSIAGSQPGLDLPTDVVATAFQRRVWEALQRISPGATRTYAQIARELGQPSATRAVARACATNPTALVVPCHRVIRSDGKLGGYRWGLQRKKLLLEGERRATDHR